jgi:hypothetical protein
LPALGLVWGVPLRTGVAITLFNSPNLNVSLSTSHLT